MKQVVVVTGAGSGIGRAIALAFAARGARLHLTDLRQDRLDETAAAVRALETEATTHLVDSRRAEDLVRLADAVYAADGRVDVLCNNAGVGHSGHAHELPLETWQEIIQTNLMGPIHGVVAFLPRLLAQEGRAHIVNTASVAGLLGIPGLSAYCASKFGVVGLTEALAAEVDPDKVRMHAVCPGIIATNIVQDSKMLAMGAATQAGAVEFYRRHGHDPARVASDVLAAIDGGTLIKLSAAGPYGWLWRLKRVSIWLYEKATRMMGRLTFTHGFPGGKRP